MASISEQRLREMEAEMNRFEMEIAPPDGGIGGGGGGLSSTLSTVEAQLKLIRSQTSSLAPPPPPPPPPPGPPPLQMGNDKGLPFDIDLSALTLPPPPPPEPLHEEGSNEPPPLLLPPPPPPPLINRPAFMPPQLRHRPPHPRPPMHLHHHPHHPMGPDGPPRFPGPHPMGPMGPGPGPYRQPMSPMHRPIGPGPMNVPQMGGPPMMQHPQQGMGYPSQGPYPQQPMVGGFQPVMGGETTVPAPTPKNTVVEDDVSSTAETLSSSAVIEAKPKVIYSAPPMRNVPKKSKKKKGDESGSAERTGDGDSTLSGAIGQDAGGEGGEGAVGGSTLQSEDSGMVVDMDLDMEDSAPLMVGGAAAALGTGGKKEKREKKKKFLRTAASTIWEDPTLAEWEHDDFRMFCGDLGNEVTDETLQRAFGKYPSFIKAKVVRDRRTNKTKGYGFVSFRDPVDFGRAMREMNGKYVGNRPIKLRKSTWKDRNIEVVRKKEKEKKRLGLK